MHNPSQTPQEIGYPGILHRDYLDKTGEGMRLLQWRHQRQGILAGMARPQQYVGFQQHGSDSAKSNSPVNDDKAVVGVETNPIIS